MRGERRRSLTAREVEVLALVRLGLTNEEIASRLGISPDTAKFHVSQILAKLGVATREEAAALAIPAERGWRLGGFGLAAQLALAAAALAAVAGVAVLAWAVSATGPGDSGAVEEVTPSVDSTPSPVTAPLGAIPWVNSTPGPYAPSPPVAPTINPAVLATPECQGDQLAGKYSGSHSAGGYTFIEFVIANVSTDECRLSERPASFQYLDASGEVVTSGDQAVCSPQACLPALLEPNGSLASTGEDDPASRALFSVQGFNPVTGSCDGAKSVNEITLTMPAGGSVAIPVGESSGCLGPVLSWFVPEEQAVRPPTAPASVLVTAAQLPRKTAAGQDLIFTVEITNVSDTRFSFGDVCPNYILIIGNKDLYDTHSLNCRPVQTIGAGEHALFAMQVSIPASLTPGSYGVGWALDAPYARADTAPSSVIDIVAP